MKILFLTYHGFDPGSGISKKMMAQINGLKQNGHEVHICSYAVEPNGERCRYIDNRVIQNFGNNKWASIKHRYDFSRVIQYCKKEKIELVYARSYMNASPGVILFFKELKRNGILNVIEIPTYPYDHELSMLPFEHKVRLLIDKLFRKQLAKQTNAIVTFSEEKIIFGQRTINISNGIDLDTTPLHKAVDHSKELHIIAVAEVHPWHGYDRFIQGLGIYYQRDRQNRIPIFFHIVGDVWDSEMFGTKYAPGFETIIKQYNIADYIIFHGKLFGKELNDVFNICSFAVGSLARHRSGITSIKTLKNREYACRGIPFIYSEQDSDFDQQPYVIKATADESPIDIETILLFIDNMSLKPEDIRKTIEHLSWKKQMQKVINSI